MTMLSPRSTSEGLELSRDYIEIVARVFRVDLTLNYRKPVGEDRYSDKKDVLGYFFAQGTENEWNNFYLQSDEMMISDDLRDLLFALFDGEGIYLRPDLERIKRILFQRFQNEELKKPNQVQVAIDSLIS